MLPEGLYEQVISKALDKKLSEDNGIKYDAAIPAKYIKKTNKLVV